MKNLVFVLLTLSICLPVGSWAACESAEKTVGKWQAPWVNRILGSNIQLEVIKNDDGTFNYSILSKQHFVSVASVNFDKSADELQTIRVLATGTLKTMGARAACLKKSSGFSVFTGDGDGSTLIFLTEGSDLYIKIDNLVGGHIGMTGDLTKLVQE